MREIVPLGALAFVLAATAACVSPARADKVQVQQARPWIGIQLDEAGQKGVHVVAVYEKTPGFKAGLKANDEILKIDGTPVKTPGELIARVQQKGVGETVALSVLRSTKTFAVKLKLEARPDEVQLLQDNLLGKPAPDFALTNATGPYAAKLADLKGNVVIVEFFATWCGPCRSAIPRVTGWQDKYAGKGLRIVAISSEAWADVEQFVKEKKLTYTVAADPDGKVSGAGYHIPAIPTLVVIDREGIVRYVDVGAGSKLDDAEAAFLPLLQAK